MSKQFVIGNWKLNGSINQIKTVLGELAKAQLNGKVAVCVPAPYLMLAKEVVAGTSIQIGAEDVSTRTSGAFTGEVSATMLRDAGCDLVLIAHSERRQYFGETNETAAQKIRLAIEAGLLPVYCVGESLEERQGGKTNEVIGAQLEAVKGLPLDQYTVAYEPTWAIGTGLSASPEQISEVHQFIKAQVGEAVQVYYGGSVKGSSAASVMSTKGVDGVLVGGASLSASDFAEICKAAH